MNWAQPGRTRGLRDHRCYLRGSGGHYFDRGRTPIPRYQPGVRAIWDRFWVVQESPMAGRYDSFRSLPLAVSMV